MKKYLLAFCFYFSCTQILMSCTFIPSTFCVTANSLAEHLIVSGTVVGVDVDGIDLEVIDLIRGEESNTTIRVWDGTDFDCNGPFSMAGASFVNMGDEIVLILPEIDSLENSWDVLGDYRWPNVYITTTLLQIQDDQVVGLIAGNVPAPPENNVLSFPYNEFVESFIENNDCSQITSTNEAVINANKINVFPNPAANDITISSEVTRDFKQLKIMDHQGNEVFTFRDIQSSSKIPIGSLSPGLYFLFVDESNRSEVIRFVKI